MLRNKSNGQKAAVSVKHLVERFKLLDRYLPAAIICPVHGSVDHDTQHGLNVEYSDMDISEVAFFKSIIRQDSDKYLSISGNSDLNPIMKNYLTSLCLILAYEANDQNIINFIVTHLADNQSQSNKSSIIYLTGFINGLLIDNELLEEFFKNDLDISLLNDGYTIFRNIISSSDEDFCIKLLTEFKKDINAPQYDCYYNYSGDRLEVTTLKTYYIFDAINAEKYDLARAMIEYGAKTNVKTESSLSVLSSVLLNCWKHIKPEAFEFIKYLFDNNYVLDLGDEVCYWHLLKFRSIAELVIDSGIATKKFIEMYNKKYVNDKDNVGENSNYNLETVAKDKDEADLMGGQQEENNEFKCFSIL